ncbi:MULTISPECIES: YqiA/YcfP family alpha/beta fold hydrolase [Marinomonas]|uniref:YqiA/YcfP family alpha/beta fold hydrolase n=1 Tax=Marinomonas TaxID=28253 RepID=UPI0010546F79|nr:YqiA/YcfP family alpha/beta fold hydrolase [Marinomonas flavescens]
MNSLLYIHGFNSSEQSHKASVLSDAMKRHALSGELLSPRLPWQPAKAIALLEDIITSRLSAEGASSITLIGSSLGGFYASYLAEKFQIKAILVNPAVQASSLLVDHIGPQHNPYTDERYELTLAHMDELAALIVECPTPDLYWLMLQEGDDVLDYREALKAFPKTIRLTHEEKGNHRFVGFERFGDDILRFAGIIP